MMCSDVNLLISVNHRVSKII